jgi:lipopolysaccharide export system protein LptA
MEHGFRLILRAGFVLLVVAGVVIVVWSGTAEDGEPAGPVGPAVTQSAETREGTPSAAGDGGTTAGTVPDGAGVPDQAEAAEWTGPDEGQSEVHDFIAMLIDEEKNREEGKVKGSSMKSMANSDENLVEVLKPILELYRLTDEVDLGPVDTQVNQVRVTANDAVLNQEDRVVRLSGNVIARGRDFEITTDSVVYEGRGRMLASDDPVHIRRFAEGDGEGDSTAMIIRGIGLDVDLGVESMVIRRQVEAKLFGISDEFLASGNGSASEEAPGTRVESVIITSSGKMTYAHVGRSVEFHENVKVVSGTRVMTCEALQIILSEGGDDESMEVKDIVATGLVELVHEGQTARGDKLVWGNVTQTGTLTGSLASVVSDEFDLEGEKLTFYRLNERFNCQGAGRLLWKAAPPADAAGDTAPDAVRGTPEEENWDVGPLKLSGEGPIRVDWATTMTYQVDAGLASFGGDVRARQGASSLTCEQLTLTFSPETKAVDKMTAEEDVKIHDAQAPGGRDVTCHKLIWNAADDTVDLYAREGDVVSVKAGPNEIESGRVVLDNERESLHCPLAGRLIVEAPAGEGAGEAAEQGEPITVTWAQSMRFVEQPRPLATFEGSVFARRGRESIEGEKLDLDFDEDMSPLKITASEGGLIDVAPAEEEAPGAPPAEALETAGGIGAAGGGHWRFAAETVVILVPEELVETRTPGRLTVSEGDVTTVSITWQESARLDWPSNRAEFAGSVDSAMPGATLACRKLKLDFNDQRELRNIWAEGDVEFEQHRRDSWHLTSGSAQAVFAAASRLRQVIALEEVVVRSETHTLETDSLQLFLEEVEGRTEPEVTRAIAQGSVKVLYEEGDEGPIEAGGDRLEWQRDRDVYFLTGKPDAYVWRGGVRMSSDKMQIDRQNGTMQALPDARPVRTEFMVRPL